ncbi:hypothetical protein [Bremerella cremea]|uniref:hypothetical protein n=1 Tax=Bremerella cremea TaxID=1031537 RepID=UPI0026991576
MSSRSPISIVECFADLTEPRTRKVTYPLVNIVTMSQCVWLGVAGPGLDLLTIKPRNDAMGETELKNRKDDVGSGGTLHDVCPGLRLLHANRSIPMRHSNCLFWGVVAIGIGCMIPSQAKSDMPPQEESRPVALKPAPDSEKEVECRVLDMSTGKITTVNGRQVVYMSGKIVRPDTTPHNYPIPVSVFSYEGTHWIGMTGDLYIYRKGDFIGMAMIGGGISWLDNLASNRPNGTLKDDIAAFQRDVPIGRLFHVFLRKWGRDSAPEEPNCRTNFSDVIPDPYLYYLLSNPPGSATIATAKFVSAAVDGKLLKVTVSDQTAVMSPSLWIDLDTKKAVKAENYEYDPDAKDREIKKQALKSIGIEN